MIRRIIDISHYEDPIDFANVADHCESNTRNELDRSGLRKVQIGRSEYPSALSINKRRARRRLAVASGAAFATAVLYGGAWLKDQLDTKADDVLSRCPLGSRNTARNQFCRRVGRNTPCGSTPMANPAKNLTM